LFCSKDQGEKVKEQQEERENSSSSSCTEDEEAFLPSKASKKSFHPPQKLVCSLFVLYGEVEKK